MQTIISPHSLRNQIWQIGLVAVLILGTSCAPSRPAITVEQISLPVDHTGRVAVTAENLADLIAFEVHLSFDPDTLEVIELRDGGFIQAEFILQNTFDNRAGTIDYAVAQIDHPSASGSGTLFEIVLRAKAAGNSPLHFRETQAAPTGALFSDSDGMPIQVLQIDGNVKIPGS